MFVRADARALRDQPYIGDHVASKRRRPPRSFADLLRWYVAGLQDEMPERVHASGLWVGRPPRKVERWVEGKRVWVDADTTPTELIGGSELGSPRDAEPFRQFIENSPRQVAGEGLDEHYVRPIRAALSKMAGRHRCAADERTDPEHVCGESPLMARFLYQVGIAGGDWRSVADRWTPDAIPPEIARTYTETALRRLAHTYRTTPETWIPTGRISDSQANAEAGRREIA